jgi:RNA polymerase sigma-70 factor (family 1)
VQIEKLSIQELQRRIALYDDETAYKELFMEMHVPLINFSRSFVQQKEVAEEIVSDILMTVWEKRKDLERIENLRVYLYISVRNHSLKYLVKQKKINSVQLEDLDVMLATSNLNPENLLISKEMVQRVRAAIEQLPPKCKMVFQLSKEDGLKYKEIASILNISVKTIDNQLAIALQKISKTLKLSLKKPDQKKI